MPNLMVREVGQISIGQRVKDGYIDATAMCKAAGKFWSNYWDTQGARAFADALAANIGIPTLELIQIVRGTDNPGTWVHPRVAIHLAMWCSAQFAVQVTGWVEEWYRTKDNPIAQHSGKSLPFIAMFEEEIRTTLSKVASRLAAAEGEEFADFWDAMHLMHHGSRAKTIKTVAQAYPKTHPARAGIKGWNQMSARKLLWYIDRPANLTESLEIDLRRCGMQGKEARATALTEGRALVNRILSAGVTPGMLSDIHLNPTERPNGD